jgi:hypothetical protein
VHFTPGFTAACAGTKSEALINAIEIRIDRDFFIAERVLD